MKSYITVIALVFVGALFIGPSPAAAQTDFVAVVEVEGYAWSGYDTTGNGDPDSGIGWISMSCANGATCEADGGHDYGVQVDSSGNLTGHAWSPNIGWIQFGGLSNFPSGNGVTNSNARLFGSAGSYTMTGWARACSATANPLTCSDEGAPTPQANAGGWDGWISLSGNEITGGTSYGVGFTNDTANANSFAWGGPNTVGWIDFSPEVSGIPVNPVTLNERINIVAGAFSVDPGTVSDAGIYDEVSFLIEVTGIPVGVTNVPYTLALSTETPITGIITQTAAGPTFSNGVTFTNVPFDIGGAATFNVDLPEPGAIEEDVRSTPLNEDVFDNSAIPLSIDLPWPDPVMTLTGPDTLRSGEGGTVSWSVSAPYPINCTVQGPGFGASPSIPENPTDPMPSAGNPITVADSALVSDIQNTSRIEFTCQANGNTFTELFTINVIPTFQEI